LYGSWRERWPQYCRKPAGYIFIDNQTRKAVKRAKHFAAFNLPVVDALDGGEDTRAVFWTFERLAYARAWVSLIEQ